MQDVVGGANANTAARAVRFFLDLEFYLIDFVANFEFRIAHRAGRMRGHVHALCA
jgi:hypothetical protein